MAVSLKILPLMTPCGRCIKTELKDTDNRNEGGKLSSGIEQEQEEEEDGICQGGREGAISKKGHFFDQT